MKPPHTAAALEPGPGSVPRYSGSSFAADFRAGLRARPRKIAPKYFYDSRGSELFERICGCDEYFPTRTEIGLLWRHRREIREALGPHCRIVEFGSGEGTKTRLLLRLLNQPESYVPIEISSSALRRSAAALTEAFPEVRIQPLCADYCGPFTLPPCPRGVRSSVIFFPGSTIGNFEPAEAWRFLARAREKVGEGCRLLIGIALVTDPAILERAYNDAAGLTAAFNRNLLVRARRELGAELDPDAFRHEAVYNRQEARIEMRLVSDREQAIVLEGEVFPFSPGEGILTEYSHKFTLDRFARLALRAGFVVRQAWTDPDERFALVDLES